jgi:hypothetical protein
VDKREREREKERLKKWEARKRRDSFSKYLELAGHLQKECILRGISGLRVNLASRLDHAVIKHPVY